MAADHLADALVALQLPEIAGADLLVDIGSGAGIPALPLAIALPSAKVTALAPMPERPHFVERTAARCGLSNVSVVAARAEAWADGLDRFGVVTARALAPLAVVAEYAAPLLRMGGVLVAWRGRRDPEDERAAATAAAELGLQPDRVVGVSPFAAAKHRHLHVLRKAAATPPRFPRRLGVARKRPLGAPSDRFQR